MKFRSRYIALIVLTGVIASSLFASSTSERAFGEITIERTSFVRQNGRVVHFSIYKPSEYNYGEPMPAVVTIHGISGSREAMESYNIELARRNFTVVSVDTAGHGVSTEKFGFASFMEAVTDAYEAVRHVQMIDPFTDDYTYGVIGHSLGAGMALLFQEMPVLPNATVIIGGGMGDSFGGLELPLNETNPANLLIASGIYDELIDSAVAYETLRQSTGLETVEEDIVYGSFQNGTARKLVLSATNHLFEISDHLLIANTLEWMGLSLQESKYSYNKYSANDHIYQYRGFANFILITGLILSIFPIVLITQSKLPSQFRPKPQVTREYPIKSKRAVQISFILSLLSGIILLGVVFLGFGFEFGGISLLPIAFGSTIILYSIIMFFVNLFILRRELGENLELYHGTIENGILSHLKRNIPRGIVLLVPVIVWMIVWSAISTYALHTRFTLIWPVEGISALYRTMYLFILLFSLIPIFYSEKIWINATMGANREWSGFKGLTLDVLKTILYRLSGIVVLLLILYGPFLMGIRFGFIMFIALLMLPFTLILGICVVLNLWVGRVTKNDLASAMTSALILALIIAGTFQLL